MPSTWLGFMGAIAKALSRSAKSGYEWVRMFIWPSTGYIEPEIAQRHPSSKSFTAIPPARLPLSGADANDL